MKIQSSVVGMQSDRNYDEIHNEVKTSTMYIERTKLDKDKKPADEVDSDKKTNEDKVEVSEQGKEQAGSQKKKASVSVVNAGYIYSSSAVSMGSLVSTTQGHDMQLIDMMLKALGFSKGGKKMPTFEDFMRGSSGISTSQSLNFELSQMQGYILGGAMRLCGDSSGESSGNGQWVRETNIMTYHHESENTSFSAAGVAKTADGKEISFHIDMEMSRSFSQFTNVNMKEQITHELCDPLVINLDPGEASFSDKKYFFDIDGDGEDENISRLNQGHGYLALDKNGDGKINDGNELFGAKTGDGFGELSKYDEDGNGWIDENDSVFHKLKVWSQDEDGNDKLVALGEVGIGAIYLKSASTEYAVKSQDTGNLNAQIRKTGIYLKEDGSVGTVQHVDVAG